MFYGPWKMQQAIVVHRQHFDVQMFDPEHWKSGPYKANTLQYISIRLQRW